MIVTLASRVRLDDPALLPAMYRRLTWIVWAMLLVGLGFQLVRPTPVAALLVLLSLSFAGFFRRGRQLVAMGASAVALHLTGTVLSPSPDWLLAIGFVLTAVLTPWTAAIVIASYRASIADQLAARTKMAAAMERLRHVADAARSVQRRDPDELLAAVTQAATGLGWDRAALYVRSVDGTDELRSRRGFAVTPVEDGHRSGVRAQVEQTGRTAVMDEYGMQAGANPVHADLAVAVGVPIVVQGELHGTLNVGRLEGTASDEDVQLLELLAQQASHALEIAERYGATSRTLLELQRVTTMKDDFLATVSHELRTPLHVVLGMAATLSRHWGALADEDRHDMVDRMHRNASGLETVIESLLDFSRLESGQVNARFAPIDVPAILTSVVERARDSTTDHDLRLEVPTDAAAGRAWADPGLVERVIDNLVTNAVRHTPPGTTVTGRVSDADGATVVEVVDDGPGIPAEERPLLTERFYRSGDPDTRASRGLGLGLAFCAEILTLHGTSLEVGTAPDGGARFRFTLPTTQPIHA